MEKRTEIYLLYMFDYSWEFDTQQVAGVFINETLRKNKFRDEEIEIKIIDVQWKVKQVLCHYKT